MAPFSARLAFRQKFKSQSVFATRFDKQDEYGGMLDEIELYINLNFQQNLTESDGRNIDIISPIENQLQ